MHIPTRTFLPSAFHPPHSFLLPAAPLTRTKFTCILSASPGPRILICAPEHRLPALSDAFSTSGCRPIHAPLVSTSPLSAGGLLDALEEAVLRLSEYAAVLFLFREAVHAFSDTVLSLSGGDTTVAHTMLAASGVQLVTFSMHAPLVSESLARPADIVALACTPGAIANVLRGAVGRGKVLVPVPIAEGMGWSGVVDDLAEEVRDSGLDVCPMPAYTARPVDRPFVEEEIGLMCRGGVSGVVVDGVGQASALGAIMNESEEDVWRNIIEKEERVNLLAVGGVVAAEAQDALNVSKMEVVKDYVPVNEIVLALQRTREKSLVLP